MPSEVHRSIDRLARADDIERVAIMPDIHLGHDICVGVAFATRSLVYPDAVGGDIGCGMAAMALEGPGRVPSERRLGALYQAWRMAVPIQRHARGCAPTPDAPDPRDLVLPTLRALAQRHLPTQLGTLGGGNHFLELQHDEDGRPWLMVHSGSRSIGQAIRAAHLANAVRGRTGLNHLDTRTEAGQAYLHDMHWARRFARASRRAMLLVAGHAAAEVLGWGALADTLYDCDHNHVEREEVVGVQVLVHRKGASPAHDGRPGIVPGSMGTPSFHVIGRGEPEALHSSAHGAGRSLSRSAAKARISRDRVMHELRGVYLDPRMASSLRDEAPSAYKDIHAVMRDQRELVRVQRTLSPVMTLKGTG
jgi:tRNA-splicing ligase RtcB